MKQENIDQYMQITLSRGVGFFFSKAGASKNLKTYRDTYLGLDLFTYANKTPIHLVTQSL